MPDLGGAHELGAQSARLGLDPLRQEGVHAQGQAREGPQDLALAIADEGCRAAAGLGGGAHGLLALYIDCTVRSIVRTRTPEAALGCRARPV